MIAATGRMLMADGRHSQAVAAMARGDWFQDGPEPALPAVVIRETPAEARLLAEPYEPGFSRTTVTPALVAGRLIAARAAPASASPMTSPMSRSGRSAREATRSSIAG